MAIDTDDDLDTSYVTLDFGNNLPQNLTGAPLSLRFAGLDTETPFVQVGEFFFKGQWMEVIGTDIIVAREGDEGKVVGMTRRRLMVERVDLKKKKWQQ